MTTTAIEFHDVTVAYGKKPVLWDIDLTIRRGALIAIVGPNGAGKSSFLKAALGIIPLTSGYIHLLGEPLNAVRKRIAYVPQRESVDWDFPTSVQDVVLMGRYGARGWFKRTTPEDRRLALEAISSVGLSGLENRQISELSGGQQQRVFLARSLAQTADLYLMDEPFASVDAATESAILAVLQDLKQAGKTVIVVHHDLQTVTSYFDDVILLNLRLIASGTVSEVFTTENLQKTYGGRLTILEQVTEAIGRKQLAGGPTRE